MEHPSPPQSPAAEGQAEFESAAHLTQALLYQVRAGRLSPVELATWLRQMMMSTADPLSDNEKSAIACTLAMDLLADVGCEFNPSGLMDLVDGSDQAIAIGRLV